MLNRNIKLKAILSVQYLCSACTRVRMLGDFDKATNSTESGKKNLKVSLIMRSISKRYNSIFLPAEIIHVLNYLHRNPGKCI
jgi:hypothetical protein